MSTGPVKASDADSGDVGSETVQDIVASHPALVRLGRVGWVAKGIVYALVGVLAFLVATDRQGVSPGTREEASQRGAVAAIAQTPFGRALLIAAVVGLVVYAAWRIVTVLLPADSGAHAWLNRAGYSLSAVVYLALAWTAITYVVSPGASRDGTTENARVERLTRQLMENPGGRWLVAVVGAVLIAVGSYFLIKGVRAQFEDQLNPRGVGPISYRHIVVLGRIGWVGRAVMMGLIGYFLIRASLQFTASEAVGLDGALRRATDSTIGTVLSLVTAIGLTVYGAYCALSAPLRRLSPADE